MKLLTTIFMLVILTGCNSLTTLNDYIKDNPVTTSIAFRYATAKYVEQGKTEQAIEKRKKNVLDVASKVNSFISTNPTVTVSAVMSYLDVTIDWDSLPPSDRILVAQILEIVESELAVYDEPNPLVNIKELLDTVIQTALYYGK